MTEERCLKKLKIDNDNDNDTLSDDMEEALLDFNDLL